MTVPQGYPALSPWVIVDGAAAFLDFVAGVFDAREVIRLQAPGGRVQHAETRIGGAPVLAFDTGDGWPPIPACLRVYVPDVDEVVRRAVAGGARVVTPPVTLWVGDRAARLADPWGNLWWVHTRVFEPEAYDGPPDAAAAEAMERFGASLDEEMRRRG